MLIACGGVFTGGGMKRRNLLAAFVVALACSQMAGYLTGSKTVSACGAGSCLAPMPEVFSEVESRSGPDFEPYARTFTLRGTTGTAGGEARFERVITPELMARIAGPHARRAGYATAFAFAPALPEARWQGAWCHGFGEDGPLRVAFELPEGARALVMTAEAAADEGDEPWVLSASCTQ